MWKIRVKNLLGQFLTGGEGKTGLTTTTRLVRGWVIRGRRGRCVDARRAR